MSSTHSLSEADSSPEERWQNAIGLVEEMMAVDESGGGGVEGSSEPIGTQTTENSEASSPKKRKRKSQEPRSDVWREFTLAKNKLSCSCNHCGTVYKCHASKNGTSTLRQHLVRCPRKPKASGQQTELSLQAGYGEVATWKYDAKLICDALTRMIIECELPFRLVEHPRFKEFVAALNPRWKVPSRPTVRKNILDLYEEVKKKLKKIFQNNGSKVSLTTDTWTSEQRQSYMVITAHFIDTDWTLQKKIINFTTIRSHKGEAMGRVIENCLKEWDIKKLFTITVDNASANDHLVNYLKRRFASIVLGEYVHMRCAAHIVNLVVVEGMKESIASIDRVRAAVKFIRASPERIQKFKECVEIERLQSKSLLCLDVCTRWNSTYLMLEAAQKFELAFERFEELEPQITSELAGEGGMPKHEDWINVRRLVTFLRYFYDLTLKVSGSSYITSNNFFHELSILFCVLKEMKCSNDVQMSLMAERMIRKCDKYWGGKSDKLNILIFVVVVFDPRYKLHYVTLALKVMYDEQTATAVAEKVKMATFKMFNEYKNEQSSEKVNPSQASSSLIVRDEEESAEDRAKAVFRRLHSEVGGGETMTELDKYLGENIEYAKDGENFNVLTWWKINSSRFPILSVIARDLLAIPISTVSSESAFSTGGRVLDSFRSSLTPTIVEALICVDDWIGGLPLQLVMVEDLSEQEAFEQGKQTMKLISLIYRFYYIIYHICMNVFLTFCDLIIELAKTKSKNASMGSSRPPMSRRGN